MKKGLIIGVCIILLITTSNINTQPPKPSSPSSKPPPGSSPATSPAADTQPITKNTFINIAQKCSPAVVNVTNMVERGGAFSKQVGRGIGSGFIINSKEGLVLTNYHVIRGATGLVITLHDKRSFKGNLVGGDLIYDVAVVKIEKPPADLKQVPLGNSDKVVPGEWVMAIGQPYGFQYTVTSGIVCALGRELGAIRGKGERGTVEYMETYLQIDAVIGPGNSGGPLFNLNGEVIGINSAGGAGYGFAVPIKAVMDIANKILKEGKITRAYLGLLASDFDDALAISFNVTLEGLLKDLGLKEAKGVFIEGVVDGSPAESVGFQEGDVLIEFDGKKVNNLRDFRDIIGQLKPDYEVKLKYLREKKEETASVKLAEFKKKDKMMKPSPGEEEE
ncbi:MAG: trypsin-like peptidase domain-containing protein [Planctomycetota bacterium]|nr:trypsin-like peptidase domain-containing protein [Planctomycetota bacterium]MDI6787107.1 trypsin-like peptidase domain-containing protein [Planctomycetota bacterium]